jgi:CDP-glycerol glycerophosphotransferase
MKKRIGNCYRKVRNIIFIVLKLLVFLLPVKNNKIVICNYFGKGYGDNGKYIVEEIIRQKLDYDVVWMLKKDLLGTSGFPSRVRTVKYASLRCLYELATAKIWIDNARKTFYPFKKKSQYYIQTWHGGLGVKCVEQAAADKLTPEYVKHAKNDSKMADLMTSNGEYITRVFKTNFWYDGEVLERGFPRNDILIQNSAELKNTVKEKLKIPGDKKILLYAPTFRNEAKVEDYFFDTGDTIKALKTRFGGDWVILMRLHPNISALSENISYSDVLINATNYDDLQELLLVADAFVTDFSSCLSDFFITRRPVFLYCTNYSEYLEERGFNLDIRELGFPMAESGGEFIKNIEQFNEDDCTKAVESNFKRLGYVFNGHASRDIVEVIKKQIKT